MNCLFKNFKKLSAKQIKTYAAIVMMSLLSFEAAAIVSEEVANPDPAIMATYEVVYEADLALENWMLNPFEVSIDEETAYEMPLPASFEAVVETELELESWMTDLFEISVSEKYPVDNSMCSPAP